MNVSMPNPYVTAVNTGLDLKGKKVVTIAELKAESGFKDTLDSQIIEVNGKKIDLNNVDMISPENVDVWYTPKFSPQVTLGIKYMKSCFDFANAGHYGKLTAAEDFTGMSDAEKYRAIYEKYQHCYGENFYYGNAIDYPLPPSEYDSYNHVIRRFEKEVAAACGNAEQARREALYGDKSDDEIRREIIDSYDLDDGISFRELYQMTYDMWKVGLDGGLHNRLDLLFYDNPVYSSDTTPYKYMLTRENSLDANVSGSHLNELKKIHDSAAVNGSLMHPDYRIALEQISKACKASSGGVFLDGKTAGTSRQNDFNWIKL